MATAESTKVLPHARGWYFEILSECKLAKECPSSILTLIDEFSQCMHIGQHLTKSVQIGTVRELSLNDASFTVELWLYLFQYNKRDQGDNNIVGMAYGANYGWLHINIRNGCPYFGFYCNDTSSETKVPLQCWTHLAFVYNKDSQQQLIYIDGKCVAVGENRRVFRSNPGSIVYFSNYAGGRVLNGVVSDVRIWKCARNETEINQFMYAENNALPSDLYPKLSRLFWFDEYGVKHELIEKRTETLPTNEFWVE